MQERLATVDTLVIDKTGTLTTGKPVLPDGTDTVLALVVEAGSAHPLAKAIVARASAD